MRQAPVPGFGVPLRSVRVTVNSAGAWARKNPFSAAREASTLTNPSRNERAADRVSPPSSVMSTDSV